MLIQARGDEHLRSHDVRRRASGALAATLTLGALSAACAHGGPGSETASVPGAGAGRAAAALAAQPDRPAGDAGVAAPGATTNETEPAADGGVAERADGPLGTAPAGEPAAPTTSAPGEPPDPAAPSDAPPADEPADPTSTTEPPSPAEPTEPEASSTSTTAAPKPPERPVTRRYAVSMGGMATAPLNVQYTMSPDEASFLACVEYHESRGVINAINPSSGAAGLYQFMPGTWNATVLRAGRPDLYNTSPAAASVEDQRYMAHVLYLWQGRRPWTGDGC